MKNALRAGTRVNRIAVKVHKQFEKWWIQHVVLPMLFFLPTALLLAASRDENGEHVPSQLRFLYDGAADHPYRTGIGIALWMVVLNALPRGIARLAKANERVDSKGVLKLFNVLEEVVGPKAARFMEIAGRCRRGNGPTRPQDVFAEITQPDQQIALLNRGLHTYFDAIATDDVDFFTALVALDDEGSPVDWFHHWPPGTPPLVEAVELRHPDSAVSWALKTRRMQIVEDIKAEAAKPRGKRRYHPVTEEPEEGSLICYPIVYDNPKDICYVAVVTADSKNYFRQSHKDLYKWIFKHFEVRIRLEHSLLTLRRHSVGSDKEQGRSDSPDEPEVSAQPSSPERSE